MNLKHIKFFALSLLSLLFLSCAILEKDQGRVGSLDYSNEPLKISTVSNYVNQLANALARQESSEKIGFKTVDITVLKTSRIQGSSTFDLPDIMITRGMLNVLANEAELACLIGHEIGHKVLHKEDRHYKNKKSLREVFLPEEILKSEWNKKREQEADEYGAWLCHKAGYDPYAFLHFMDRMARFQGSDLFAALDELTATHKDFRNRAKHLQKFLAKSQISRGRGILNRAEYVRSLVALGRVRSGDVVNELLPGGVTKALARLQEIAQELDEYEHKRKPMPAIRFITIMEELAGISGRFEITGIFPINGNAWQLFMKEVLSQDTPIWDHDELGLKIQDILQQLGRLGVGFIPVAGDAVDLDEFLTGVEFGTGHSLSINERVITVAGLLAGSGKMWREVANGVELTLKDAKLVSKVGRRVAADGQYAVKRGAEVLEGARQGKIVVIGSYPRYLQKAEEIGAHRFNIPDAVWRKMSNGEKWATNQKFLNRAIMRGDEIILSNPVKNIEDISGTFRQELDYLIEKGFRLSKDGTRMIRP